MSPNNAVRAYYASLGEREWARLESTDDGIVEFAVTCHTLARYLPTNARVLDIGGGPGRYTIWLAHRGHSVSLADLCPELLSIARTKIGQAKVNAMVEEVVEADARDLSRWDDHSFDAVLSLGPFYHLPGRSDRDRAASELHRVLRRGGIAFVAVMPRYAFLRRTLAIPEERCHLSHPDFIKRVLEEGVFINDTPGRFTDGYGALPEEVTPFFGQHGFTTLALLAAEGIAVHSQSALSELAASDPIAHQAILDVTVNTAGDPSILGMAAHLLYVGKRSQ